MVLQQQIEVSAHDDFIFKHVTLQPGKREIWTTSYDNAGKQNTAVLRGYQEVLEESKEQKQEKGEIIWTYQTEFYRTSLST